MIIREYVPDDCKYLAKLFYETVHAVNAKDYTKEQLDAWADGKVDLDKWNRSFLKHYTVVAVKNNEIVGFGDIDKTGYLDRLYVHKNYQNCGIASAVCDKLEHSAAADLITTYASVTAKPFFEGRGYRTVKKNKVIRNGIWLLNYLMEKRK